MNKVSVVQEQIIYNVNVTRQRVTLLTLYATERANSFNKPAVIFVA